MRRRPTRRACAALVLAVLLALAATALLIAGPDTRPSKRRCMIATVVGINVEAGEGWANVRKSIEPALRKECEEKAARGELP